MKVAILAGGKGTRLSQETVNKPKPMVEIGGWPILWHIMKVYQHYGFNEFVVALGYKGALIKDSTVIQDEGWQVEMVDTGEETETGGRIKRLQPYVGDETFMLTWGDGLSDIDLNDLLAYHKSHGKLATVTAVHPPSNFGCLEIGEKNIVEKFVEKPKSCRDWINGAFFVLEPEVFDYIKGDETVWEKEPMERLAQQRQLVAYPHLSFWQCMDTAKDKKILETYWGSGNAPWKVWGDDARFSNRS